MPWYFWATVPFCLAYNFCNCRHCLFTVNARISARGAYLIFLGPVYMEKSCPGQEGHPPSRVNFTVRLYEKNVDPSARAKN